MAFVLLFAGSGAFASEELELSLESEIIKDFQQEFDLIENFAKNVEKPTKPEVLLRFIDEEMMRRWSAELTIRAIIGRKLWSGLESKEKQDLINAYRNTMRRYLFEVFLQYNGQKPLAERVELNSKGTKGWLTSKLVMKNFPDIVVDLKLYNQKNQWFIYDFRFQGISFIKLKQSEYQTILNEKGAIQLAKLLNDKNTEFFKALNQK